MPSEPCTCRASTGSSSSGRAAPTPTGTSPRPAVSSTTRVLRTTSASGALPPTQVTARRSSPGCSAARRRAQASSTPVSTSRTTGMLGMGRFCRMPADDRSRVDNTPPASGRGVSHCRPGVGRASRHSVVPRVVTYRRRVLFAPPHPDASPLDDPPPGRDDLGPAGPGARRLRWWAECAGEPDGIRPDLAQRDRQRERRRRRRHPPRPPATRRRTAWRRPSRP